MGQHLRTVGEDEPRVMPKNRRNVVSFHPALGLPAQEFDFLWGKVLGTHDSCGAIVFLETFVLDKPLVAEVLGHGSAGIGRGMLDIGPIYVAAGEFEIGLDGLASVAGTADDQTAHHVHLVAVEIVDGL